MFNYFIYFLNMLHIHIETTIQKLNKYCLIIFNDFSFRRLIPSYFLQGFYHILNDSFAQCCDLLSTLVFVFGLEAFFSWFWDEKELVLERLYNVSDLLVWHNNAFSESISVTSGFSVAVFEALMHFKVGSRLDSLHIFGEAFHYWTHDVFHFLCFGKYYNWGSW